MAHFAELGTPQLKPGGNFKLIYRDADRYSIMYNGEILATVCQAIVDQLFPELKPPKKGEWADVQISIANVLLGGRPVTQHEKNFLEVPCTAPLGKPVTLDDLMWDGEYFVNKHTIDKVRRQQRGKASKRSES